MPLQATSGAASYDAFGGGVAAVPNYIEECFSTTLYTGNGSTQTITNGIDLAGKGGLVWQKSRTSGFSYTSHILHSPNVVSGSNQLLLDTATTAAAGSTIGAYTYQSTGFSINGGFNDYGNASGEKYASWTFRKQPKFFDVVTYTGNGSNARQISHSLGSSPGFVIIKRTDSTGSWWCWHSSFSAATDYMRLNTTEAVNALGTITDLYQGVSSTAVTVGTNSAVNGNGMSYVMYVFAHNAGGFGLTGTDNVISCGSYVGTGNNQPRPTIDLGYEPQFVMIKAAVNVRTDTSVYNNWAMVDVMRGMPNPTVGTGYALAANLSEAEAGGYLSANSTVYPTATGFQIGSGESMYNYNGCTYIYIAIRRGPMKVPTSGTSVFSPVVSSAADGTQLTSGFPVDMQMFRYRAGTVSTYVVDRLRGVATTTTVISTPRLLTDATDAESNTGGIARNWDNTGFAMPSGFGTVSDIFWSFRRAPSFFDEVCYTGNGTAGRTITHNLTVTPELIITKERSSGSYWYVYSQATGATQYLRLEATSAAFTYSGVWNDTSPTASVFTVGSDGYINASGQTYVAYLFATCLGVSKVTSFTGNGSSQTINCGFTSGARFVMIKRVDSTGNWTVFDTARGISSGNDPALYLNSTAAEVTGVDAIDPDSTGFIVNQESTFNLNVSSATYLVLAIA